MILLDLVMPRLDGVGALKQLRDARPGDRADELRRRRQAVRGPARGRGGLPAQGRRAGGAREGDPPAVDGKAPLRPAIATRVVEEIAAAAARRPRSTTSPRGSETCSS